MLHFEISAVELRASMHKVDAQLAMQPEGVLQGVVSKVEQLLDVGPDDVFFDSLLWDGVTPTELQALVASSAEGGGGAVDRVEWLPGYGAALLSTGPGPIKRIFIVGLDTWRLEELRDG